MSNYFSTNYFSGATKSNYDDYTLLDNDGFWKFETDTVKKYLMSGRMLDIGCAYGYLLKRISPFFKESYGVDISKEAVSQARKIARASQIQALDIEAKKLPFKDELLDLVTILEVLEHTKSIAKTLKEIYRILKPKGYLIASLPIKGTWVRTFFGWLDKDRSHIGIPNERTLLKNLKDSGFKVLEKRYFIPMTTFKLFGIPGEIEVVCIKI